MSNYLELQRTNLENKFAKRFHTLSDIRIKTDRIISIVQLYSGYSREELESKSRKRTLVEARYVAMNLILEQTDITLVAVGQLFGGRDHTTVLHAKYIHSDHAFTKYKPYISLYEKCKNRLPDTNIENENDYAFNPS